MHSNKYKKNIVVLQQTMYNGMKSGFMTLMLDIYNIISGGKCYETSVKSA